LQAAHDRVLAGSHTSQSKLEHATHSVPAATLTTSVSAIWREWVVSVTRRTDVTRVAIEYWLEGQLSVHRVPARTAPSVQSALVNGVSGVGSTHCELRGPVHFWHARSHARQMPPESAYWPSGQRFVQRVPSRMARTVGGHVERLHAWLIQAEHWVLRGPVHWRHVEWHGWHTRLTSA
jgi:hypothetical protein